MSRRPFLAWLLFQSAFASLLLVSTRYCPHLHPAAIVAIATILLVYAGASACAGLRLWWGYGDGGDYLSLAIRVTPMLAILGTAVGFLIAFSGDVAEVQQRVTGASTGIVSTIVGVACTIVLMVQKQFLELDEV